MWKKVTLIPKLCLFSLMVLTLANCVPGTPVVQPTQTRPPLSQEEQARADVLDQFYSDLTAQGEFSGAVIIEHNGTIVLQKGYGMADRQKNIPNTTQTRIRLFNASKPFTALGIMILVEQGQLKLDDPACTYIDDCPTNWEGITIENLLTVGSGLPDYTVMTPIKKTWQEPISKADLLTLVKGLPKEEGVMITHTWEGASDHVVLGHVIERVSGQTYEDFIQQNIIEKLGLKNTGVVKGQGNEDNLAVHYQGTETETAAPAIDMSNLFAFGNIYSSAEDMFTFLKAVKDNKLLTEESMTKMLTPNEIGLPYDWGFWKYDRFTWVILNMGLSHARTHSSAYGWTTDNTWVFVVLANQEVNTVRHYEYITCLPAEPGMFDSVFQCQP